MPILNRRCWYVKNLTRNERQSDDTLNPVQIIIKTNIIIDKILHKTNSLWHARNAGCCGAGIFSVPGICRSCHGS